MLLSVNLVCDCVSLVVLHYTVGICPCAAINSLFWLIPSAVHYWNKQTYEHETYECVHMESALVFSTQKLCFYNINSIASMLLHYNTYSAFLFSLYCADLYFLTVSPLSFSIIHCIFIAVF